jgi:DNA-binding transcriptional regulator YdaS (Cro superfamily)
MPNNLDMNNISPIKRACDLVGGPSRMARLLEISPATVSEWIGGRREVPVSRCPTIERLVGGAVRCEELRGDVEWAVLRGTVPAANDPQAPQAAEQGVANA